MTVGPIPDVDTNLKEQAILNRVYDDTAKSLRVGISSDIQIGAVEIKDSSADTRATVTSNGALLTQTKEVVPTDSTRINGSMTISNSDTTVVSTKVLTKTIGSTSYTKTISYNAAGDVVSISAWSVE